jgi:hypothetical protein
MHARRGNLVGATGQAAKAVMEEAHAILCERGQWVLNEKRLLETAGLAGLHALFGQVPSSLPASPGGSSSSLGNLECRGARLRPGVMQAGAPNQGADPARAI